MKGTVNIFTPQYYPKKNGLSFVVQKNVESLLILGFQVNVLTAAGSNQMLTENIYKFNISGNGSIINPIRGEIDDFIVIVEKLSKKALCNIYHGWHIWSTNLPLKYSTKIKCKQVVYSHGIGYSTLEPLIPRLVRRFLYLGEKKRINSYLKELDGFIYIGQNLSHPRSNDVLRYDGKNKTFIPNPIPVREVTNANALKYSPIFFNNKKTALCISNFERVKNQRYLISLAEKYNFNLILIGSEKNKFSKYLEKMILSRRLDSQVKIFYSLTDDMILNHFQESDFFLFPSRNDYAPLVLIESNKYGLPFISFTTADIARKGGVFCHSQLEFENAILSFVNMDQSKLKRIGECGKMYYLENNEDSIYLKNIQNFMNKIIIKS